MLMVDENLLFNINNLVVLMMKMTGLFYQFTYTTQYGQVIL